MLRFAPNPWKHNERLTLRYAAVTSLEYDASEDTDGDSRGGSLMFDELLPADGGIEHEFVLTSGTLRIKAGDVVAVWESVPSD